MSEICINSYGDRRIATPTGHGVDVASQRADDLDQLALDAIAALKLVGPVAALEVGCGHGGQAVRMMRAGAVVTALDAGDFHMEADALLEQQGVKGGTTFFWEADSGDGRGMAWFPPLTGRGPLSGRTGSRFYWKTTVQSAPALGRFDIVLSQRMIHYLPYHEARRALSWMLRLAKPEARLYLSASGIGSELGDGYEAKAQAPAARFGVLAPPMAQKHGIHQAVCLYDGDELQELVDGAGWHVEKVFVSAFGNIKLVARRDA